MLYPPVPTFGSVIPYQFENESYENLTSADAAQVRFRPRLSGDRPPDRAGPRGQARTQATPAEAAVRPVAGGRQGKCSCFVYFILRMSSDESSDEQKYSRIFKEILGCSDEFG